MRGLSTGVLLMFLWGALVVAAAEVRKCKQRTTVVFTHHGVIVIPR